MAGSELIAYVNASTTDLPFAEDCWTEAAALVTAAIGTATVPAAIVTRATLEAGSELFHRRQAPNGIAQFATDGAPAVRVARDPMVAARPILAPYIGLGIG